jgi:ribonuclease HI
LIFWQINETALKDKPYSDVQFAFRSGMSTDNAISAVCNIIEQATLRRKFALGVFLDVAAAFDNISIDSILRAMRKRGINPQIITWYDHYIRHRTCNTTIKGIKLIRALLRGSPQGGVLSVLVWNLVFDELLDLFKGLVKIFGFADDAALLILGRTLAHMYKQMNAAIVKANQWAEENGLTLSPHKTIAVLFTRKLKFTIPQIQLRLGEIIIPLSSEAKYLGVILDRRLTWRPHVLWKLKQCTKYMFMIRNAIKPTWGPPQLMMKWIWTAVVRPKLMYSCVVWAKECEGKYHQELKRLQRLALMQQGHFRKGTPGAALELLADTPPLHLFLESEMLKTGYRLKDDLTLTWPGLALTGPQMGHVRHIRDLLEKINLFDTVCDRMTKIMINDRSYSIDMESLLEGSDRVNDEISLSVYTDGSKMSNKTGAGFTITRKNQADINRCFHLGDSSVFLGEMCAIREAAKCIILDERLDGYPVIIMCDSQAAIISLNNHFIHSKLTLEAHNVLQAVARDRPVTIRWIKAHVGYAGNELADTLARVGAGNPDLITDSCLPMANAKAIIKHYIYIKWNQYWWNLDQCRQTKIFFPDVGGLKAKKLYFSSKTNFSLLVRWITGHNFLKRHNMIVNDPNTFDVWCRLCELEPETSSHIITTCPSLWMHRWVTLGWPYLDPVFPEWSPGNLIKFIKLPLISSLECSELEEIINTPYDSFNTLL